MKKVILDTNVYIRCLHSADYQRAKDASFLRVQPLTFFCAVVAEELLTGCRDDLSARRVLDLYRPYLRARRTVTPLFSDWEEAGRILGRVLRDRPGLRQRLPALRNDVLVALCAARIGASVLSANRGDFALLAQYRRFSFEVS